jgi:hypothetical protein
VFLDCIEDSFAYVDIIYCCTFKFGPSSYFTTVGPRVHGCGGSTASQLPYRNATKLSLPIFVFEKNNSYFKILINLKTYTLYIMEILLVMC